MSIPPPPPDPPPPATDDRAAVIRANESFYDAFQGLDLPAMERVWAEHAPVSCVHPGWMLLAGRARVLASWAGIFKGTERIRFLLRDTQVFLSGSTAWVVCIEEIEASQAGSMIRAFSHTTNLFQLEGGGWRLVHHHAAPMPEPVPRASSSPPRMLH